MPSRHRLVIYPWRKLRVGPKRWDWRLVHANGRTIATSGHQGYNHPAEAQSMGLDVVQGLYAGDLEVTVGRQTVVPPGGQSGTDSRPRWADRVTPSPPPPPPPPRD